MVIRYAIFALDTTGHIASCNPGAQRFKGYIPSEIIGRHFSIFYPAADIAARKPDVELEVAASVGRLEDEGWRRRKDGTRFWANVVITAEEVRRHVTFDIGPVNLSSAIERVSAMIAPQAASKSIGFRAASCRASIVALADAAKLEQVLLNVLSNPIKFTPAGGEVSLRCDANDSRVFVIVEDTGAGIPADRRTEIFEPFVQLDRSLMNPRDGTGLGLAISRDLARAMNGDLTMRSEVRRGVAFTLELPRAGPDGIATPSHGPTLGGPPSA